MRALTVLSLAFPFLALSATAGAAGADWPYWRGPDRNGISTETDWDPQALRKGPVVVWKKDLGPGHTVGSFVGDRMYTMGHDGSQDVVYCLNAETGEQIWKFGYPCPAGNYPGPRATPVVDKGKVYTVSREGLVHCLDAKTGRSIWKRHAGEEFGARLPKWGIASSAVIEGNYVLVNAGVYGLALDKRNGKKVWFSAKGIGGYAAPVVFTLKGRKGLAVFGEKFLYLVDLKSGRHMSEPYPWETRHDVNAADPILFDDKVFISSGYGRGCTLLQIRGKKLVQLWENREIAAHFSSGVYLDGFLYGMHGNTGQRHAGLKCLDPKDGSVKWSENIGFGALMAADGKLIVFTEKGELVIAKAKPDGFEAISRGRAIDLGRGDRGWAAPVLVRGRIYCRSTGGTLACIDVRK